MAPLGRVWYISPFFNEIKSGALQVSVDIRPVENKKQLKQFVEFPWLIYQAYPHWAPPLKSDVQELLNVDKHPFWRHGKRELFLAYRGDKVVGRIGAIIDFAHNELHHEKQGSFGFFECADDEEAAAELFKAVENYHRIEGAQLLRGPLNPSLNYEAGLLVKGYELPAVIGGTYNPPYYSRLIENSGLQKEKDLFMWRRDSLAQRPPKRKRPMRKGGKTKEFSLRPVDLKHFDKEAKLMLELFKGAWKDNWGFTPATEDEFQWLAGHFKEILLPEFCIFVERNGDAQGFVLALPDANVLLRKLNGSIGIRGIIAAIQQGSKYPGLRVILAGFLPSIRSTVAPLLLMRHFEEKIIAGGYKYLEEGWVLEDNKAANLVLEKSGSAHAKTFRIFRKDLS